MSTSLFRVYRAVAAPLVAVVLAAGTAACAAQTADEMSSNDDRVFVQLREAARKNDPVRAAQLAAMIPNYPAPSYLEYFQIKPQLFDSAGHARLDAPDAPVLSFLSRYDGQAIADRMRNDYLLVLGARHDWRNFDDQYKRFVLDDDTQVKCYALESRAARGENVADMARELLVEPKYYGDACVDLITALATNKQFSSDDVRVLAAGVGDDGRGAARGRRRRRHDRVAKSWAVRLLSRAARSTRTNRATGPSRRIRSAHRSRSRLVARRARAAAQQPAAVGLRAGREAVPRNRAAPVEHDVIRPMVVAVAQIVVVADARAVAHDPDAGRIAARLHDLRLRRTRLRGRLRQRQPRVRE